MAPTHRELRLILEGAQSLLSSSETWVKQIEAVDARGRACPAWWGGAVRWDLLGALNSAAHKLARGPKHLSALLLWVYDWLAQFIPENAYDDGLIWGSYWRLGQYQDTVEYTGVARLLQHALEVLGGAAPITMTMPLYGIHTHEEEPW